MTTDQVAENEKVPPPFPTTADDVKSRLYRGEHLEVVRDYLDGRLVYSVDDWRVAGLIALAMRHHFAALERDGRLSVDFTTEQIGDGLAVSVRWPEDSAIDEFEISFELEDEMGNTSLISRRFEREMESGPAAGRLFARSLASNQTVVLRPVRSAVAVKATARPSHRLRFSEQSLAPDMRSCAPKTETASRKDFAFRPVEVAEMSRVDVYWEARGREVLELISLQEQREREQRARARRRRRKIKRILIVTLIVLGGFVLAIGALAITHRFFVPLPDWVPFVSDGATPDDGPDLN